MVDEDPGKAELKNSKVGCAVALKIEGEPVIDTTEGGVDATVVENVLAAAAVALATHAQALDRSAEL